MTAQDRLAQHVSRIANQLQQAGLLLDFAEKVAVENLDDIRQVRAALRAAALILADMRDAAPEGGA